jgi:hypothetical protein
VRLLQPPGLQPLPSSTLRDGQSRTRRLRKVEPSYAWLMVSG